MNFVGGRATTTANPSASREKRDPRPSDKLPDTHTEQRKTALKYEESFVDKNFIVTGATGAIGSAVAKKLLGAGATVALFARDADKLENLVRDPACRMGKYFAVCHNFKEDPKILERKVRESIEKLKGKLDGLICCHGTFKAGTLKDTTIKDWDVITNVNVRTFIMMTSLCVPFLKMTKGNAVILTSTAGEVPTPGALAFCVSKSMVNMMIECAALELAYFGVRVNGVAAGMTQSNTLMRPESLGLSQVQNDSFLKKQAGFVPLLNKLNEPEDVADSILWVASEEASFLTGEIITVDGAQSLTSNQYMEFEKEMFRGKVVTGPPGVEQHPDKRGTYLTSLR